MARPERTAAELFSALVGADLDARFEFYDGSCIGPDEHTLTVRFTTADALRHLVTWPLELGFGRAYVSGELVIDGDLDEAIELRSQLLTIRPTVARARAVAQLVRQTGRTAPARPPEEFRRTGRLHSLRRDAAAISHHYDVPTAFYELLLGPSMTYSCAAFPSPRASLEEAQSTKNDLVCDKLGLRPGMRMLDIGCGWGSLALHAARNFGVTVVGVTLAEEQMRAARERANAEGLNDRVQFFHRDYREVADGPYDAIASVGMFEHVGVDERDRYFRTLADLLEPGGRLLNHAIGQGKPVRTNAFVDRYVFPDGELQEVGATISAMHDAGLEVRHMESLREHYARTIRAWRTRLDQHWDEAVELVGPNRARVWKLYLAGMNPGFDTGFLQLHQVVAVKPDGNDARFNSPTWSWSSLRSERFEPIEVRSHSESLGDRQR